MKPLATHAEYRMLLDAKLTELALYAKALCPEAVVDISTLQYEDEDGHLDIFPPPSLSEEHFFRPRQRETRGEPDIRFAPADDVDDLIERTRLSDKFYLHAQLPRHIPDKGDIASFQIAGFAGDEQRRVVRIDQRDHEFFCAKIRWISETGRGCSATVMRHQHTMTNVRPKTTWTLIVITLANSCVICWQMTPTPRGAEKMSLSLGGET